MFLSQYLVFKIVAAAVTGGRIAYPDVADLVLKYDNANKLFLSGGAGDHVSDMTLFKDGVSYELGIGEIINKTTTTAYELDLPSNSVHATFGINQDATRYVYQYAATDGYQNGKFQVYSGTPSGGYTEYGSTITPFGGDETVLCSMSADGKYILVTTWDGGNDGYKMYKDTGSEYAYHSAYSFIGSHTSSGYTPAFVPSNNNFVITGTNNSSVWLFKLYVYDSDTESWTAKDTVTPSGSSTADVQRGQAGKGFTYDGSYFFQSNNGATTRGEVWSVDWDGNTMTKVWHTEEGNNGDGAGGAISPDNRYVVLARHDGSVYRVYENMSGDWSTTVNVSSEFDLTGSGTSTVFGSYGINFSGYSSINTTPLYIGQNAGFYGDGFFRLENWSKKSPHEIYINKTGKYSADLKICGLDYKTNEVTVSGSITPYEDYKSTVQKLYPSDGGTVSDSDYYGYVGLSGNGLVMVVVGRGDDDTTSNSGGFIVYEKVDGVWTFTQQITNVGTGSSTLGDCDEGKSVQLDYTGTRVFIGAHADDHTHTNSGSVYIYRRVAKGNWTLEQRIDGGGASYRFGHNDVNNDGDKLMIGSYGYPGSGNIGRAWYYTRSGTTWSLQEQLAAPSTSAYGNSVSINSAGTRAIIGGYSHSSTKGRADIWNYSGSWSIGAGFTGVSSSDFFGYNVDMSNDGNTVVVGAPLYSNGGEEGRAYIYTTSDGTNWSLLETLSNQDNNEWFGFSVQISGDGNTVVIGGSKNDDGLTNRGKSYVYVKSGGSWPSTPTYTILGTTANANNGHTLGISDTADVIISGAPFDDDKGTDRGAVYVYEKATVAELKFDDYNKLSLANPPTNTSSRLSYGSNVYDIGTLTSNVIISKTGEYVTLTKDAWSNVAYFSNATVTVASTQKNYDIQDQVLDAGAEAGYSNAGDTSQGGFGNSIDMSADGTRMIVGNAHWTDTNGRARIYHLESGSWVLKQAWDGGTRMGSQVAMNEAGTRAFALYTGGGVKIWDYTSGAWDTSASGTYAITPGSTISQEVPAVDCNKAGDVVIIGSGSAKTWVYRLSGGSWSQDEEFDRPGAGVAMNGAGTRCFMGHHTDHKVWESNYSGGSWGTETEIIEDTSVSSSRWPSALSTDSAGETLCILNNTSGEGAIYERAGNGSWSASVSDILSVTEIYGTDKPAISYDGTVVLFGHKWNSGALSTGGHALLYTKSGSTWSLAQTLLNPSDSQHSADYFGGGLALAKTSKDRIVVAALGDDNAGSAYGAIYTYSSAIPKYLDFDTYNKLTINDITPTSTTLKYGSNTYDTGTATSVYIKDVGTYDAEITASDKFALVSNVVGSIDLSGPTYTPGIQWSFNNTLAPTIDDTQIDYSTTSLVNASVSTNSALVTRHTMTTAGAASTQYATKGGHTALRVGSSYAHILPKAQHEEVLYGVDGSNMWKGSKNMFMGEWTVEIDVYFDGSVPTSHGTLLGYYISSANEFIQVENSRFVAGFWYTTGGSTPNRAEYHMDKDLSADTWYNVKIVNIPHGSGWKMRCYINDEFVEGYDAGNGIKIDSTTENSVRTRDVYGHVNQSASDMILGRRYSGASDAAHSPVECYVRNLKFYPGSLVEPFIFPSLTFDTYNKLSINDITPTSTSLKYGSNTYDIGTATSVYIEDYGTYDIETKNATTFALTSNTVTEIAYSSTLVGVFHHGAFTASDYSSAYSTVSAAATAGHVYSDTSTGTYSWGTLNSVDTSTSGQTGYSWTPSSAMTANVLIVGGGGGGGTGSGWPTGGGGGEVQNLQDQTISAGTYTIVVGNGGGVNTNGTSSVAFGTTANPGTSAANTGGTSGSGNGPGSGGGGYDRGGGGGDASVGGGNLSSGGGSGGDGSNVSWLDGSIYGEQVSGKAYFGGGSYSGDYTGAQTNGKGNGVPGTGGGAFGSGQVADSGIVVIKSVIKAVSISDAVKSSTSFNLRYTVTGGSQSRMPELSIVNGLGTHTWSKTSSFTDINGNEYDWMFIGEESYNASTALTTVALPYTVSLQVVTGTSPSSGFTDRIWNGKGSSTDNTEQKNCNAVNGIVEIKGTYTSAITPAYLLVAFTSGAKNDQGNGHLRTIDIIVDGMTYFSIDLGTTNGIAGDLMANHPTNATNHSLFAIKLPSKINVLPNLNFDGYNKLTISDNSSEGQLWPPSDGTWNITTDNSTTSEWTISGASYGNGSYKATSSAATNGIFRAYQAFEGTETGNTSCWQVNQTSGILSIELPYEVIIDKYAILCRNYNLSEDKDAGPKDFTFEGSFDGSSWVTLDTVTGNSEYFAEGTGSQQTFTTSNTTAYKHYRLNVTANNGDSGTVIGELKLLAVNNSTNLKYLSNTYDIGTATNIYIEDTGTYEAEKTTTETFALTSKAATIGTNPYAAYANYRSIGGISAASSASYGETVGTTYSVTMWAKNPTYGFIRTTNKDTHNAPWHTHDVLRWNGGKISHITWDSGNSSGITYNTNLDATSKENEWHFYGFKFNGTSSELHLDGAAPISGTTGLTGSSQDRVRLHEPAHFENGERLAEFAVYNRALTDAEFVSIYNNGKPNGPDNVSSGRVSWFKCLSGAMGTNSGSGGDFDCTFTEDTDVPDAWKDPNPSLTFDGYNKLSLSKFDPTSSTLKYGSNTYDIGTATNIYIENAGTYNIEAKNASTFVLASNVNSSVAQVEPVINGAYGFGHALTYDGKLYGWGRNGNGALGVGDASDKTVPTLCTGITQGEVVSIWNQAKRGLSRWAKTRDGRIWVAGEHSEYCLPGSSADFTTFTDVSVEFGDHTQTSNNVVWASGSERATQVLMENGDVWSFGNDSGAAGILGQGGSATSDRTPRKLSGISNVTKIVYNGDLVLALDSSNVVWMWGSNSIGHGSPNWGAYNVPTNIMGTGTANLTGLLVSGETVTDIECGSYSMFVITSKGTVYATGKNGSGQLGQGGTTAKSSSDGWVKIEYFTSNAITVNKLYTGNENPHVFADTSDGWYCWGENGSGALGLGDTTDKTSPVKWTNVSNIKKFGTVDLGCYAITEDGKYYAWGEGQVYTRGDNATGDISYPKYIDALPNILAPSFEFDGYDKISSYDTEILRKVSFQSFTYNGLTCREMDVLTQHSGTWYAWNWEFVEGGGDDPYPNASYARPNGTRGQAKEWYKSKNDWRILRTSSGYKLEKVSGGTWESPSGYHVQTAGTFQPDANGIVTITFSWNSHTAVMFKEPLFKNGVDFSTKFTKGTTTYDVGSAQNITVSDPGTYDAQLSKGDFALKSETVPATKTTGLYTWAFHHGNFDNAYGDGDILTARDNGRFYADTPVYASTSIGTITPSPSLTPTYTFTISAGATSNTWTWDGSDSAWPPPAGQDEGNLSYSSQTARWQAQDYDGSTYGESPGQFNPGIYGVANYGPYDIQQTESSDDNHITFTNNEWSITHGNFTWKIVKYDGSVTTSKTTYTFAPPSGGLTANVMMIAGGGGGGGRYHAGGGGAGGLVYTAGTSLASGSTKTIVVGNGDSGGNAAANSGAGENGWNGKNTTFTGLTSAVGGGGGGRNYIAGEDGGSGGGGGASQTSSNNAGGSGTAGQGNAGGAGIFSTGGSGTERSGGGGGGAGGAGIAGVSGGASGEGGIGKLFGTGSSFTNFGDEYGEGGWFAGGGGGGVYHSGSPQGIPGRGGGGYGANQYGYMGMGGSQHALPHTGGGGGASGTGELGGSQAIDQHPGYGTVGDGGVMGHGGRGGSGIVLIQTNVAPPNGANTAVVQVGNPRRRSSPPAVDHMGSEVNRWYIIDSQSMPTYKLPTHWYADPPSYNGDGVPHSQGSHSLQKRADGGTSNVWYQTSYTYFSNIGTKMTQSVDAVFMPVEQQRYDVLLSIGDNTAHDIQLEMAADGTAKLYRNNGATLLQAGTITCFTVGKWHHIALTVDSEHNAVGYVNGHPVVSTTYTSNPDVGSREGNMHMRVGVTATFRKFLVYEVSTYNFHMTPKQVLQRAAEVGLGPKLEYDDLNTLTVVNTESGSSVTIYEQNTTDTSNIFAVSCESSYTLSNAATYYAEIKGTETFTITRPLTVSDDVFPLYQYPPVVTGTKSSLTTSVSADTWNTWTMSGASTGNGQYQAKTSHTTNAPGGTNATAASLFTNGVKIEIVSSGGASIYSFLHTSTLSNFDITLQLPSAKIIRKYVLYPADTDAPVSTPGGSVDPTLPGNGGQENTRRPKSWVFKGSANGSDWTNLDTVSNKPPSIYGDVHTISSPASYLYYRLSISANNGSSEALILGEWQLWGDA